jgi:protein TonB
MICEPPAYGRVGARKAAVWDRRLSLSFGAAVAIHGLVFAVVGTWQGIIGANAEPPVVLVFLGPPGLAGGIGAATGTGKPAASVATRSGTEAPDSARAESNKTRRTDVTVVKNQDVPRSAVTSKPQSHTDSEVRVTDHGATEAPAASGPTGSEAAGAIGSQASAGRAGSKGGSGGTATYEQILAAWLDRHKYYPTSLRRRGIEGEGRLRIRIARSGNLLGVDVVAAFSHPTLAATAEEWVRRAEPFPPVPDSMRGEDFEFVVPIGFRLR